MKTARAILNEAGYGRDTNIMTPDIIRIGKVEGRPDMAYELSSGRGIGGGAIYGVTVARAGGHREHSRSRLFHDLDEAESYIARGCGSDLEIAVREARERAGREP